LSTDDIVFEDIKYREPKKARRPDRDRRWACLAYEVPKADDLPIFLDRQTADAIERHALRDTSVELGGIILGHECVDDQTGEPFVWVTKSLEAKHYENTQASFTYTHEAWEEITRERDKLHPDLDIVGWYHTHPDFGIFLSSHDLFIHRNFFNQPLQLAYVVDPIRQTRGFFRWRDNGLEQVGGYYLSADRGDRIALARLVNDLESLPNADAGGGGGGLSPRLEAELIAMLSRPYTAQTSQADRAQVAALFGMMGLFAGVVLVAALAWLYSLNQQMQDQTVALGKLGKTVDQTDDIQRLALETLLAKTEEGRDPRRFVEKYHKVQKDLDETMDALKDKDRLTLLAMADIRRLEKELESEKKGKLEAVEKANEKQKAYEDERERARELSGRLDAIYDTPLGKLSWKYSTSLYAAIAGWVVAILASLGLLAMWMTQGLPEDDEPSNSPGSITVPVPGVTPGEPPAEEPPHHIT
jgi:proteasome lid subunit RPN8/RPN11/Skp family chaperone for outer membrane proteins